MTQSSLTKKCPYCSASCEADWVDIVVDLVQAGPFHCTQCLASQIGRCGDNLARTDREKETGWYEPPSLTRRVGEKKKRSLKSISHSDVFWKDLNQNWVQAAYRLCGTE